MALHKLDDWSKFNPEIFSWFMDGLLLTAGTVDNCNTMAVGWGALGSLWSKPACTLYVRPTRHTYQFCEREEYFSLCQLPESMQDKMNYCGTVSGRDADKFKETGLHVIEGPFGVPLIAEAKLALVCKKIWVTDMTPDQFQDPATDGEFYPLKDYHRVYTGQVLEMWGE